MKEEFEETRAWLKSIFNINKELDFERESVQYSLKRIKHLEMKKKEFEMIYQENAEQNQLKQERSKKKSN